MDKNQGVEKHLGERKRTVEEAQRPYELEREE